MWLCFRRYFSSSLADCATGCTSLQNANSVLQERDWLSNARHSDRLLLSLANREVYQYMNQCHGFKSVVAPVGIYFFLWSEFFLFFFSTLYSLTAGRELGCDPPPHCAIPATNNTPLLPPLSPQGFRVDVSLLFYMACVSGDFCQAQHLTAE